MTKKETTGSGGQSITIGGEPLRSTRRSHMGSISTMTDELEGHDQEQIALMEERLILLDQDDNAIGEESKKTCTSIHLATSCATSSPHAHFSIARSLASCFAPQMVNSYCKRGPPKKSPSRVYGPIPAAVFDGQRKENCTMNLGSQQRRYLSQILCISLAFIIWLLAMDYGESTKVGGAHHSACANIIESCFLDHSGSLKTWKVDYILFLTAEVDLNVNPNECSDVTWVSPTELKSMIADPSNNFTPWFKLIVDRFLFPWWNDLLNRSKNQHVDAHLIADAQDNTIHRMGS
ncbi:isopentenyl-diphosphate Delta-isomerase [Puccinia sorghi]|uniref:Isopentenyl-diphosphate Delta-isomerase n=1 Tax=Puccinia sorghi TaxID=27349 RepID=A0A0L6U9B7_9BASI|nr:isopentenyl-diphosphate Delta-isomerase [Puccinia sorghi]